MPTALSPRRAGARPAQGWSAAASSPQSPAAAGERFARFGAMAVGAYLVLKMIYLFNEGSAQPADLLLATLAFVVASPKYLLSFLRQNSVLFALLIWITIVNFAWFAITAKLSIIYFVLFYAFNVMIVATVYSLRLSAIKTFDRYIILALQVSITVQFLLVLVDSHGRAQGSFQNPNQLAYWGIVVISIYLLLRRNTARWIDLPFILMSNFCVFASLSRAGFISCLLMAFVWAWFALRTTFNRLTGGLAACLIFVAAYQGGIVTSYIERSDTAQKFENRLETKTDTDLGEGRNYNRIVKYYQYTIFGAGEGFYARFEPTYVTAIEIHSSFATMLFSYGIIGLSLFMAFLFDIIRRLPLSLSIYIFPSLVYGITHQGLRFSFFWVLIGIMMALGTELGGKRLALADQRKTAAPTLRPWKPRGPEELRRRAAPAIITDRRMTPRP